MTASERLRELHEPARAYIERKELGNENVVAANTFVDALVEVAPFLISVVEAAEAPTLFDYDKVGEESAERLLAALTALCDALQPDAAKVRGEAE